jgi:hypothetical protein
VAAVPEQKKPFSEVAAAALAAAAWLGSEMAATALAAALYAEVGVMRRNSNA